MKTFSRILKKSLIILMLLASIFIIALESKTHADAGYHSSYGGGSSSSSHSSSSSSHSSSSRSSSSYSSSSGSYSGGSGGIGATLFAVFIVAFIIIIVLASSKRGTSTYVPPLNKATPNQAAIDKLKQLIPGFDEKQFLDEGYKIFLDVEDAWMNFELDKVRGVLTDELLNMYESQLSSMEVKGEQNIMSDFVLKDCAITNCKNENDNIEVTTKYTIEFYDYIIDKASGKVLRGTKTRKLRMYYDFTFIKSVKNADENKVDVCPNCGAEVKVNAAGVCEYCGTKIIGETTSWVMSKKVCTSQVML
jgi:predicted lipid-binding transport protein (Tim44 family)